MAYNVKYNTVVSADRNGMIEYWVPDGSFSKPTEVFGLKSSTDLYEYRKVGACDENEILSHQNNATPCSIHFSPDFEKFAAFSFPDRLVRVFSFCRGKVLRTYDESIDTLTKLREVCFLFGNELMKSLDPKKLNLTISNSVDESPLRER